ncbi:MAG: hypothetical protein MPJ24_09280 [Pirellulaceae bacterium]|nr:hypothetical protein [Pirellulaceae bacterium]
MLRILLPALLMTLFLSPDISKGADISQKLASFSPKSPCFSTHISGIDDPITELVDQIRFIIKPGTPSEKTFLTNIETMMRQGTLSTKMVREMFAWAKGKPANIARFPYFERGLRVRAARVGVVIP